MPPLLFLSGVIRASGRGPSDGSVEQLLDQIESRLRHRAYRNVRRSPERVRFESREVSRRSGSGWVRAELPTGRAEIVATREGDDAVLTWRWDCTALVIVALVLTTLLAIPWVWVNIKIDRADLIPWFFLMPAWMLGAGLIVGRGAVRRLVLDLAAARVGEG